MSNQFINSQISYAHSVNLLPSSANLFQNWCAPITAICNLVWPVACVSQMSSPSILLSIDH